MNKISSSIELKDRIQALSSQHSREGILFKEQFLKTCDELRPSRIIKRTCHELLSTSDDKVDVGTDLVSLGAGFIARQVVSGGSINPFRHILAALVQKGVIAFASKHGEGISSFVKGIINRSTIINRIPDERF
jgi:hypothetical protein